MLVLKDVSSNFTKTMFSLRDMTKRIVIPTQTKILNTTG